MFKEISNVKLSFAHLSHETLGCCKKDAKILLTNYYWVEISTREIWFSQNFFEIRSFHILVSKARVVWDNDFLGMGKFIFRGFKTQRDTFSILIRPLRMRKRESFGPLAFRFPSRKRYARILSLSYDKLQY